MVSWTVGGGNRKKVISTFIEKPRIKIPAVVCF
jgi:hypothetical protein